MKKIRTDIFSGIGVFLIQLIINFAVYLYKKNEMLLFLGITLAVFISLLIALVLYLVSLNKQNDIKCKEKDDKINSMDAQINKYLQDLEELSEKENIEYNKCAMFDELEAIANNVAYIISNKKKQNNDTLKNILFYIENIFRDDVFSKNIRINTSIFIKDSNQKYRILASTKHSPETVEKCILGNESFVASAFVGNSVKYCRDIDKRTPDIQFVERDNKRKYKSILAIPCSVGEEIVFVLVITSTKMDSLYDTYDKYKEVLLLYLNLAAILIVSL